MAVRFARQGRLPNWRDKEAAGLPDKDCILGIKVALFSSRNGVCSTAYGVGGVGGGLQGK